MLFYSHVSKKDQKEHRLHYQISGRGAVLVLLHNGFYSSASFDTVVPDLEAHFTCVRWDRQGYGFSRDVGNDELPDARLDDGADELDSLLSHIADRGLKTGRVHLWGHCMGGAIAAVWAARHPLRVQALFLEATGFYSTPEMAVKADLVCIPWHRLPTKLRRTMQAMHGAEHAPRVWASIIAHTSSYIMNPNYDIRPTLKKIACPTLIGTGDRDIYFSRDHAKAGAAIVPDCRLWLPEECGHDMHRELPKASVQQFYDLANFV